MWDILKTESKELISATEALEYGRTKPEDPLEKDEEPSLPMPTKVTLPDTTPAVQKAKRFQETLDEVDMEMDIEMGGEEEETLFPEPQITQQHLDAIKKLGIEFIKIKIYFEGLLKKSSNLVQKWIVKSVCIKNT